MMKYGIDGGDDDDNFDKDNGNDNDNEFHYCHHLHRGMPCWLSPSEFCNAKMQDTRETLINGLVNGDDVDDYNLDEISQITDDNSIYVPDRVEEFLLIKVFFIAITKTLALIEHLHK